MREYNIYPQFDSAWSVVSSQSILDHSQLLLLLNLISLRIPSLSLKSIYFIAYVNVHFDLLSYPDLLAAVSFF